MTPESIVGWSFQLGFITWFFASLLVFAVRIAGWAYQVVEDLPSGSHRNRYERLFMEWLGYQWSPSGRWLSEDMPKFGVSSLDRSGRRNYYQGNFIGSALVYSMVLGGATILAGLCVVVWKLTLPILLFIVGVYALRHLRRKAKAKQDTTTPEETV